MSENPKPKRSLKDRLLGDVHRALHGRRDVRQQPDATRVVPGGQPESRMDEAEDLMAATDPFRRGSTAEWREQMGAKPRRAVVPPTPSKDATAGGLLKPHTHAVTVQETRVTERNDGSVREEVRPPRRVKTHPVDPDKVFKGGR